MSDRLPPEEAFAVLGNDIRMEILQRLGGADEPLAFSTLYDRVDVDDSAQFNYHLDKTVGQFVARTDAGYRLTAAGQRVIEAVVSGAVTDRPEVARTEVDVACPHCDAPVESTWAAGSVELYCTDCAGRYGQRSDRGEPEEGYLGRYALPPAGTRDRTAMETLEAAWTWGNLEALSLASGLCPRCSATVRRTVTVCDDHDAGDGLCGTRDGRYRVAVGFDCSNCPLSTGGEPIVALTAATELLEFLTDRGMNPVDPDSISRIETVHGEYDETVVETEPLVARYTFTAGEERLTLAVDDELAVTDARRE